MKIVVAISATLRR